MITTVPGQASYDLGVEIGQSISVAMDAGYDHSLLHEPDLLARFLPNGDIGLPRRYHYEGSVVTFWPAPSEVWEIDFQFYGLPQQAVWPVPADPVDTEFTEPRVVVTEGASRAIFGTGVFGAAPTGGPLPDDLPPHPDDRAKPPAVAVDPDLDDPAKPPA